MPLLQPEEFLPASSASTGTEPCPELWEQQTQARNVVALLQSVADSSGLQDVAGGLPGSPGLGQHQREATAESQEVTGAFAFGLILFHQAIDTEEFGLETADTFFSP